MLFFYTHQTSGACAAMCACDRTHQTDQTVIGDSKKFLFKKSVTETHCNRLVNHWILKIYQILKLSTVSWTMTFLRLSEGSWDRDKEVEELAWVGNGEGGGKKVPKQLPPCTISCKTQTTLVFEIYLRQLVWVDI